MWGSLPTQLLQAAGGLPFMLPFIATALEKISSTSLSSSIHVRQMLSEISGTRTVRPCLFQPHDPTIDPEAFTEDVNRVISTCNIHRHTVACYKEKSGQCRFAMPQPTVEKTRSVQLVSTEKSPTHPNKYDVYENIDSPSINSQEDRNLSVHILAKKDSRTIIWEKKRPPILPLLSTPEIGSQLKGIDFLELPNDLQIAFDQLPVLKQQQIIRALPKRNGLISEYNPAVSALLGCNTNVSNLGSDSQAKAALCYILKYITKPNALLDRSISLVYHAREQIKIFPSQAEDTGTEQRTAMHFLTKILNDVSGLAEISAPVASACIMGMPAETCTHEFHLLFINAALAYVDALILEFDNDQLDSSLSDHSKQKSSKKQKKMSCDEEEFGLIDQLRDESDNVYLQEEDEQQQETVNVEEPDYEPTVLGLQEDDSPWENSEVYSTCVVYTTAKGKMAVPQVVHYRFRGGALSSFNMDDYAALIVVVKKKEKKEPSKNENKDGRGRKANGVFEFDCDHPMYESHVQQLRSKPHIPIYIGRPPKPPGKRQKRLTEPWKKQARRFARYILMLFRPWTEYHGQLPGPLTWKAFCDFVRQLRDGVNNQGQTFLGTVLLNRIRNVAQGMRVSNSNAAACQGYRFREATIWGVPDGTAALPRPGTYQSEMDEEEMNRSKTEREMTREARLNIEALRSEASADDFLDRTNQNEVLYNRNTLTALDEIMIDFKTFPNTKAKGGQATERFPFSNYIYNPSLETLPPENLIKLLKKEEKTGSVKQTVMDDVTEATTPSQTPSTVSNKNLSSFQFTQQASDSIKSDLLNVEQTRIWKKFDEYFREYAFAEHLCKSRPKPLRIFIHGGPGI